MQLETPAWGKSATIGPYHCLRFHSINQAQVISWRTDTVWTQIQYTKLQVHVRG